MSFCWSITTLCGPRRQSSVFFGPWSEKVWEPLLYRVALNSNGTGAQRCSTKISRNPLPKGQFHQRFFAKHNFIFTQDFTKTAIQFHQHCYSFSSKLCAEIRQISSTLPNASCANDRRKSHVHGVIQPNLLWSTSSTLFMFELISLTFFFSSN